MFYSVIIPTFNRRELCARAIESVLKQKEKDFELIVVDDGSEDETFEYLNEKYGDNAKISIYQIANSGVSVARNFAATKAKGKYLAFLDSDDEWLPKKLSVQKKYIIDKPSTVILHSDEIWIRNGKRVNQMKKHRKEGGDIFVRSLDLCLISPSAVVIKKELFDEFGGFDPEFIVCEDYDLWLKMTSKHHIDFIEEPLITKYGGHEDQLSRKYFAMDYWRVKSMYRLLKNGELSEVQAQKVVEKVLEKAQILMNGYKKHNNLENYNEIEEIFLWTKAR